VYGGEMSGEEYFGQDMSGIVSHASPITIYLCLWVCVCVQRMMGMMRTGAL